MRKYLLSTIVIFGALSLAPIAEAFPFIRRAPKPAPAVVKPTAPRLTPEIQMPSNSAISAETTAPAKLAPPASAQERQAMRSRDSVAQATFWLAELQKSPKEEELSFEASQHLRLIGANERAIEIAAIGIQDNAESGRLWGNLGLALLANKQNSDAVTALTKAKTLAPNNVSYYNGLGIAYDNINRSDLAIVAYQDGYKINPNDASLLSNMGLSQALSGNLSQAEATLRRATSLSNAPVQARQNLALIVGLQGRLQESELIAAQDLPPEAARTNIAYIREMLNGNTSKERWNGAGQNGQTSQAPTARGISHASN